MSAVIYRYKQNSSYCPRGHVLEKHAQNLSLYIVCAGKTAILLSGFLGHASLQRGSKPVLFLVLFISFHLITDTACYPGLSESLLSLRPAQWLRSTGK